MNRKVIIYFFVGVIAGFIVAGSFGWGNTVDQSSLGVSDLSPSTAGPALSVSLMFDYGDGGVRVYAPIAVTAGETMMQLLENQTKAATLNFTTKNYAGLGKLVETIGRKTNGEEGKYWQYWVNNQYVPVGADSYIVKPGDVIEWKFIDYKNN